MPFTPNENKLFKNQFLVSNQSAKKLKNWNERIIDNYFFYFHPSLKFAHAKNSAGECIIIGDAFDYKSPEKSNHEIANALITGNSEFDKLVQSAYANSLCGTYIIFYFSKIESNLYVSGDTAMQRELFHFKDENGFVALAASDKLINLYYPLTEKKDQKTKTFYNSNAFKTRKSHIANSTNYKNLSRLKSNYYLNISSDESIRYFPNKKVKNISVNIAAEKGAEIIKGYIKAIYLRYPLMIPVSAGWDSRLFLAASKEIKDKVVYYVLQTQNKGTKHYDIRIPTKLMSKLGIPFEIINYSKAISNETLDIIEQSISFYRKENFEYIVNYFYKKHPGKVTLNGNVSEILRLEFDDIYQLDAKKIAHIQRYPFLEHASDEYTKWLKKNKNIFNENGFRLLDMLYWEENCSNWVSKSKTEFRTLGIEVFSPFNSRELITLLYGVKKRYRRKQNPVVYKKMIQILWAETLQQPINPGTKKVIMRITQKFGIFSIIRNIKLQFELLIKSLKN